MVRTLKMITKIIMIMVIDNYNADEREKEKAEGK